MKGGFWKKKCGLTVQKEWRKDTTGGIISQISHTLIASRPTRWNSLVERTGHPPPRTIFFACTCFPNQRMLSFAGGTDEAAPLVCGPLILLIRRETHG